MPCNKVSMLSGCTVSVLLAISAGVGDGLKTNGQKEEMEREKRFCSHQILEYVFVQR